MAKLTDFKLLTFDVYGTLIDWETGVLTALQPLLDKNNKSDTYTRKQLLEIYHQYEASQQEKTPDMSYCDLLATIHPHIAKELDCESPSEAENKAFGDSVGKWPAFSDTVDALRRLAKHYKLVVLSNVDRNSFSATNSGPLQGVPFNAIITAQDVGSYKSVADSAESVPRSSSCQEYGNKELLDCETRCGNGKQRGRNL
jgi:2-haloalkanoic acid dehalogenase type II